MGRNPNRVLRRARHAVVVAVALAIAAMAWAAGPGGGWVLEHIDGVRGLRGKDLVDALDSVRARALTIGTLLAALVTVYYTARNSDTARRGLRLNEDGDVTERYTKAIEQLGSDKLDVRLGGIYALERVAADSVRDHPAIMEVLATFIREHTVTCDDGRCRRSLSRLMAFSAPRRPTADIQAALTVICRRTPSRDTHHIDLSTADLTGTDLHRAVLADADLRETDLTEANLMGADLRHADLSAARLNDANLNRADLYGADLSGANLRNADMRRANLDDADLTATDLTGARTAANCPRRDDAPWQADAGSA